jgi:hypothetical protein
MKLETIDITTTGDNDLAYRAREHFLAYRKAIREARGLMTGMPIPANDNSDDAVLMRSYRAIARGQRVLNLHQVMQQAGLHAANWLPKLAICRADRTHCSVRLKRDGSAIFYSVQSIPWGWKPPRDTSTVRVLPSATFDRGRHDNETSAWCVAPSIPPPYRPPSKLQNYHLLWEAHWNQVPVDPLLLRDLGGGMFAVLAQWDLTPLEQAVLRGRLS